jgi:hypothetical protein
MTQIRSFLAVLLFSFLAGFVGAAFHGSLWQAAPAKAQNPPDKAEQGALNVKELRLTDDSGRTRLLLTLVRNKPRLFMLDESGEYRLEMGLGDFGEPHIWLRDADGASKVQAALTAKGLPSFTLADQRGRDRAVLALSQEGEPALILRDPQGQDRVALWRKSGEEGLALADKAGKPLAALAVRDGEAPALMYFEGPQAYQVYR